MTSTDTDRLAEIKRRAKHQKMLDRSLRTVRAKDHVAAVDDRDFLLSLVEQLQLDRDEWKSNALDAYRLAEQRKLEEERQSQARTGDLDLVEQLQGQLDALEPIAAPRRRSKADRERYRKHAAWQNFEHYLKQAEAAAAKWQREADWLREARDERKADTEAGAWPPCEGCDEHPAKALGLGEGADDEM